MVRTRSGKSTTKAEKEEEKAQEAVSESPDVKPSPLNLGMSALKKVLSPLVSPFVSPITSPLKKKPATLTNLTSPMKSPLKSPSKAVPRLPWHRQLRKDLTVWSPTEKTFTLWACFVALAVLIVCGDSVYWQMGAKYPDFHFLALVLAIHVFDVLTNFVNEFKGNGRLDVAILFTEAAVNASEALVFVNLMGGATYMCIMVVVISTFNVLSLNIGWKDEERLWVRAMAYVVLGSCFAMFGDFIHNTRLTAFASAFSVALVMDIFDFPDKPLGARMCEGSVMLCRSIGVYMLITADLLKDTKHGQWTMLEQNFKSLIGQ